MLQKVCLVILILLAIELIASVLMDLSPENVWIALPLVALCTLIGYFTYRVVGGRTSQ